jgi:hypothetical protein
MHTVNFCPFFHIFNISFLYKAQTRIHACMHTYIHTYVYYTNSFDLLKIRVTQNLQEHNDCVTRGAPVIIIIIIIWLYSPIRVLASPFGFS